MASVTWCQTTGFKLVFNEWLSGDVLRRTGSTAVLVCLTYKYKQRPQGQRSGPCYHRCSEFYKFNLLRKQFLSFVSEWPEIFCLNYYSANRKSQYICVNSLDLLPPHNEWLMSGWTLTAELLLFEGVSFCWVHTSRGLIFRWSLIIFIPILCADILQKCM